MKRIIAIVLTLVMALSMAAFAEGETIGFDTFEGMEWEFSSGVGAWSTNMRILPDGSFSGEYHDSEMGETGDEYPEGTIYGCSFTGKMRFAEAVGEYAVKIHIDELKTDGEAGTEYVDGEIRYVITAPYGISEGDDMVLYLPGTPVDAIPEDMHAWAHLYDGEEKADVVDTWFLCSEKNGSGFLGYRFGGGEIANPWLDLTENELMEMSGMRFGVPEGAQDVIYRYLPFEDLSEMQFTIGSDEFCARIMPAALEKGELMDIAGMYFDWENEEEISVGPCYGTIGQAQTGTEEWVELCLWYDMTPGIMYSLSVHTTDPDGLDLVAIAQQVYVPAQGDA